MFIVPADWRSWVPGADASDFPIQNLPYIQVDPESSPFGWDGGCMALRIGDQALFPTQLQIEGLLSDDFAVTDIHLWASEHTPEQRAELRKHLAELLKSDNPSLRDNADAISRCMCPVAELELMLPMAIPQFVDFYSGINHASNVGKMFRPDMPPLLPNYRHLPVGYNGRASSVVPSGTPIVRPNGQLKRADKDQPDFGPCEELDFELELGFFTNDMNDMGEPVPADQLQNGMLGMVLVNDWSARDIQRWEYQPLGPFLAKSFATSISPYLVQFDALEPFKTEGEPQIPEPLPYLKAADPRPYDIQLEVLLNGHVISRSNAKYLYWSFLQQLAHQTSNGTPVELGDLYASGTISGPDAGSEGSLLELTLRGANPISLPNGETRKFLQDGDELTLRGWCEGNGYRIGLGEVTTVIQAAPKFP